MLYSYRSVPVPFHQPLRTGEVLVSLGGAKNLELYARDSQLLFRLHYHDLVAVQLQHWADMYHLEGCISPIRWWNGRLCSLFSVFPYYFELVFVHKSICVVARTAFYL